MKKNRAATPEIIDNLRRVFQVITEYSKTAEKTSGITGPQLWALKILAKTSPLRVSELAHQMYLRPATVVGILDRLEGKGLVTRTRSKEDRRAIDLNLTEKGKDVVAKAPEVAQVMLIRGLEELTDEQFTKVSEGMDLLVRILGADAITPQPLHSA
ncbi:MarR family winged helix-turn-helix transcriptional regulator [Geomobilimonas luticola]|uniref:MarR family transcriptional regulator n=1 Tax=Geomobilimonas luticola TaxID=1114878 RepID=A0ABS5SFP3_9BACT|nr:MarR family transcriptional regulator [Geomobilimonas luticola]MBT0653431.1 MarR family transcriptional regulator [Geomobilimonas luticola]